jgi:hypothetical protein
MQRYLSTGVSTLVSLMAMHRAAARGDESASATFAREEIRQIDAYLAYLREDAEAREAVSLYRDAPAPGVLCA